MLSYIIYKITNKVNNKIYVGYTSTTALERWKVHCYDAMYEKTNQMLHKAIRKYGVLSFDVDELACCALKEDALFLEQEFIQNFQTNIYRFPGNGYNMTDGGEGGSGYKHSEQTIQFLREKGKQYKHTEGSKRKISEANKGKTISEEQKQKISQTHRGKTLSDAHRKSLSKSTSFRNKNLTAEQRQKLKDNAATARAVEQYTKDGEFIAKFSQIQKAAAATGIGSTNISSVCKGRTKTAGGFVWKYSIDFQSPPVPE